MTDEKNQGGNQSKGVGGDERGRQRGIIKIWKGREREEILEQKQEREVGRVNKRRTGRVDDSGRRRGKE